MDNINSLTSYEEMCSHLKSFSHDFCQRLGFNMFKVSQYYLDGSLSCLGTDLKWNQISQEENYFKDFAYIVGGAINQLTNNGTSDVIWSSESRDACKALDACRNYNNSLSGFNLLLKSPGGIISFGFSSTLGANTVQLIKSQNISVLNQFLLDAHAFVAKLPVYKTLNILPDNWLQSEKQSVVLPSKISLTLFGQTIKLSERQSHIFKLTAIGHSYKETAYILGMSQKAIEFHVGVIREHFNKRPMSVIVSELHKTGTFHLLNQII